MPITVKKAKGADRDQGSDPAQASVTEIVTHVAQQYARPQHGATTHAHPRERKSLIGRATWAIGGEN
jgi:hypothetical protein